MPLTWDLFAFGASDAERQGDLLERLQPYVPSVECVRVHLYADSEFRAISPQRACQGYGWHWQVGLKSDEFNSVALGAAGALAGQALKRPQASDT